MAEIRNMNIDLSSVEKMHDLLLQHKPSEAFHDVSTCPYCVASVDGAESHNKDTPSGGGDMSTYTQDELQAAIADAMGPVQQELTDLKASQEQAAIEAQLNELAETHDAEKADLQTQLDQAKTEVEASKKTLDELVAYLDEEAATVKAEAALDARRTEVQLIVAEFFTDEEYIEKNLDRWASMDVEAFEDVTEDWKVAQAAKPVKGDVKPDPLVQTAMQASSNESTVSIADARKALQRDRQSMRSVGASTR